MREQAENRPEATASGAGGFNGWAATRGGRWLVGLALALGALVVFSPVTRHEFISYDDPAYVTANRHVQNGLNRENFVWAFRTSDNANWHPLTWLSHMLDCDVFGVRPGGHHLMSAGFHALNTALLFLVLAGMTGAMGRSAVVAALFGLHPLHVESAAWVSERKDVLSAFFFILTIWAYGRFAEILNPKSEIRGKPETPNPEAQGAHPRPEMLQASRSTLRAPGFAPFSTHRLPASFYYIGALLLFALGLMSKPMVVTTPVVLLLLDYWPLRRFESSPSTSRRLARLIIEKLPFLGLSVVASVVTWLVQKEGGAFAGGLSLGARVGNALIAYASYIGKMLWPVNLAIFYPHPIHPPLGSVLGAAVLLAAVTVVVLRFGRGRPYLLVGWLWYLGMLVPVIGLVQVGSQAMADRYTYLPLIGLFVMLVWGLSEALGPRRHQVMAAGAGLALASCALLTTRQLGYWQDNEALFGHALAVTPNNFLAHENLGLSRLKQGRVAEAIVHLREAARLAPGNAEAQKDLGSALLEAGQFEEAIIHLRAALELKPGFAEAEHALGSALFKSGRMTDAIAHFRQALAASPDLAEAHNNLGDALRQGGRVDEAITHFQAALALQPDNAIAYNNLGAALRQKGQLNEAITQFRKALALRPDSAETHNNLANALGVKGQVDEAILHFQTALRLQPNNATIRDNFGRVLLLSGRVDEAVGEYRAALELQPADAEAWATLHRVAWVLATCPEANRRNGGRAVELARQLDRLGGGTNATTLGTLAAAYAEAGSFDEAAASVQKALRLAVANTNTVLVEPFQAQLAAYQIKAPWRDPTLARPGGARKPE